MSDSRTGTFSGLEEEDEEAFETPFLRRSARATAGQAPDRYGNWIDFTFPSRPTTKTEENNEHEKTMIENVAHTSRTTVVKTTEPVKTTEQATTTDPVKTFEPVKKTEPVKTALTQRCHSPSALSFTTAKSKKVTYDAEIKQKLEVLKLEDDEEELKLAIQEAKLKKVQRQKERLQLTAALSKCRDDDQDSQKLDDEFDDAVADPTDPSVWISKNAAPKSENKENDITSLFEQFSKTLADSIMHATKSQAGGPRNDDGIKTLLARQSGAKELPSFSGSHKEWTTFISAFRRSTLSCKFSNDENIQRLNRALTGRAKLAVQALMVSPDNLEQILKTLERKFGNPTHIMEEMVETIRQFPNIRDDRPYQIVDLSNEVEGLVATAKSLKKEYYLKNPILMKELVSKLPLHLSLRWGEVSYDATVDGRESDLEDFQKWLVKIAEAVSSGNIIKRFTQDKNSQPSTSFSHGKYQKPRHEAVMITRESSKKPRPCILCNNGSHSLEKCKHFESSSIQERWNVVKDKKICFCCLRTGHNIKLCRNKKSCGVDNCQKPHHPALHEAIFEKPSENQQQAVINLSHIRPMPKVMLKIATVKVSGPKGTVLTHAILDEGATASLMENSLARTLGLDGKIMPLQIIGAKNMTYVDRSSKLVNVTISGAREANDYVLENVRTVQDLELPTQTIHVTKLKEKWRHIPDVQLNDLVNAKPTLLLGQDNLHLIITREIVEGPKQGPVVSRTRLGWVIHGNNAEVKGRVDPEVVFLTVPTKEKDDSLHELVKYFFTLESTGIKLCGGKVKPKEEARALEIMEKTTRRLEGSCHYETGLLWKDDDVRFPDTHASALRRLYSVENKMDQDQDYAKQYCQKMQDYIDKGYAKKLTNEEAKERNPKVRLVPHFGVVNPNKKLRIVFDAASKSPIDKKSLNDFLLSGPDFYNPLAGVLCKFRQKEVAICADIKEMFPQIKIRPDDSKAQRFLWRGMERRRQPDTYEMTSMIFGAKSSPSSAQFVKNKNAEEFQSTYPEAAKAIVKHHYMDDLCDSCHSEEDAMKLAQEIIHVHAKGGFQICNWVSSSATVLESIPENIRGQDIKSFQESQTKTERVLGIYWNPREDMFQFTHAMNKVPREVLQQQRAPTKREVLQLLMSIFDPLGLLSHHTVKAKILMQKVWRSGIEWDDPVSENLHKLWTSWLNQLEHLKTVKIPRSYSATMKLAQEIQLHVFSDASEDAFAVAAYFRVKILDTIQVALVIARSNVAPLKKLSMPKLELQAALYASRVAIFIKAEHDLPIARTVFWTDSTTVLHWIRSDSRKFQSFVAHRIGEIEESTDPSHWRYVPTKLNVADDATRDVTATDLSPSSRWFQGPDFLRSEESFWPVEGKQAPQISPDDLQMKKEFVNLTFANQDWLPNAENFSKWPILIRTTALVLRCVAILVHKKSFPATISQEEMKAAEHIWLKEVQRQFFHEEIQVLQAQLQSDNKKTKLPSASRLSKLSVYMSNDGLIRVKSRLQNSPELNDDTKNPIVLEPNCRFTELLINYHNCQLHHIGLETLLNELRQRYWIIGARAAAKRVIRNCQHCKIQKAKPKVPEMAALPEIRTTKYQRPFTVTGLDYFGPMHVKIGRRHEKRYGALFTCLSTRAVHIELADSLTTDSAINAITRFTARRGNPRIIYSDNGTNFRGAATELRQSIAALHQDQVQTTLAPKEIEWKFIPPLSPHFGGAWERLVRSVKTSLVAILHEQYPTPETLHTLLLEAEHTINSRPLTHVSINSDDPEALTPMHFLLNSSSIRQPPGIFDESDLKVSTKHWRQAQYFADQFWKSWIIEYLPTLSCRQKWRGQVPSVKEDDVVIISDPQQLRNTWPKGVVTKLSPGNDGKVRVVDVKTLTRNFKRNVSKLIVLDVHRN